MLRLMSFILFATFATVFSHTYQEYDAALRANILKIYGPGPPNLGSRIQEQQCVCVPNYQCTEDHTLTTDGRGIIDVRADEAKCSDVMSWCCKPSKVNTTKVVPPVEVAKPGCGWRHADGVGFRTIGDENLVAKFGEFPWMVAILYTDIFDEEMTPSYQCGGSLIHPQAVITAAHCVHNREKKYLVRAGEWDTQTVNEIYPHEDRNVKSKTIHKDFYQGALLNDIAFLLLDSPFTMTYQNVGVACLPPQGIEIPSGTRCFATGWGKDKYGRDGEFQVILKKINLPIVERDTCQANIQTTRPNRPFTLNRSFICAGGEKGMDMCDGDGGSPLVCQIPGKKGRFQQVGIVSYGIRCGEKNIPGLYVDVAFFRDWVDQQVAKNNLDSSVYAY